MNEKSKCFHLQQKLENIENTTDHEISTIKESTQKSMKYLFFNPHTYSHAHIYIILILYI
jgi:hypothetical protein